ncbi:VOC family protein [Microlunatus speluncae]|uniref:VOC family protein n=1 Tax=Microlunatus speluncae TaxID=2594267 RepID=UPI00126614B1|nr:VOC family protein [Microlunatus speluncae]
MFRGFATTTFFADDIEEAARWYAELLGIEPYYRFPEPPEKPAYLEFRIGDSEDELGFIDRRYAKNQDRTPGGAVVYWHVDDLEGTLQRLKEHGATEYQPLTERGSGFNTAQVVDPFGNILGVMNNPHYLEVTGHQS